MNKTLLILGGTGFIGHEVVIQAVESGWQVKALVRSAEGARKLRQIGAHPVVGDIYRRGVDRRSSGAHHETWRAE